MKQINTAELHKKRTIQRIEIPFGVITQNDSITEYLKTQYIVGISGKKFDF